ncbi:MAG TPA: sugar-binding protein [Candidatus Paceibacterota bacterium]|nr:sugar-binding protein [Candidatus Paceibacterota bacterium]
MQRKTIPLVVAIASCLISFGARANDIQVGKEYYSAIHSPNPIVLDGDLSEWGGVPVLADPGMYTPKGSGTNGTLVFFEEYNGGTWTGPDDQTSAVQIVYDAENVYFGFVVTDDYHENAANSAWNGDSVQLMIANADRNQQIALYNYALGGVEGALGEIIVNHEAGPATDPGCGCDTEAVIKRDSAKKRTTYEIKLPRAALGLSSLAGGTKFGLGMCINDGDELTPGQKGWSGLGAHSIVHGKTPSETAMITLAKQNDIESGKEVYTANPAPKPIVVDGNLSEWTGVPVLSDPKFWTPKGSGPGRTGTLVLFEEYNGGTWTGPDDQTSAVQIAYDADNVYFGFVVTDDYHENAAMSAWNGDSVQLMIANAAQNTQVALYNYALGGIEDSLGDVIVNHEAGPATDPACGCDTEAVITRNPTTKRTTYEIKLPMAALGLTSLKYGTQFGLGMAINDGDETTPGQKGWGGLGAHAIVHGKSPTETALITLGVGGTASDLLFFSAINPAVTGFSFRVNDKGESILDPASVKLYIDGELVTVQASPKVIDATDFTYTRPTYFPPNSDHTYIIEAKDTKGNPVAASADFKTIVYGLLTANLKVTPDTAKRGFIWNVHQNSAFQANNSSRPLEQLGGLLGRNYADRNAQGIAIGAGTAGADNQLPVRFEIDSTINMCPNGGSYGDFPDDGPMPGIPGSDPVAGEDGIAGEVITYIELPAGKTTFAVRSDDGFKTTTGNIADAFQAQVAADSVGAVANLTFNVYVEEAGVYAFRTVWEEGNGDAYLEWSSVLADGSTKALLNDTANGGLKTYRAITGKAPAAISLVSPAPNATSVAFDAPVIAQLRDGQDAVDAASVKLTVDGTVVNVQPTKVGDLTTIKFQPAAYFVSGSAHTASIAYTAGGTSRTETWNFTVATYPTLTKAHQAVSVDKSKPGFMWSVFQNETYLPNSLASVELALAGQLKDPSGNLLQNLADPSNYGYAVGPGTKVGAVYRFELPGMLNLSQMDGTALGNFSPDEPMPGIPGTSGMTDGIDAEVITFVELPAGVVSLTVVSDDSFRAQAGYINKPADSVLLSEVDGTTANVTFRIVVQDAGVYPIRVIYQEGGGDAGLELSSVKADGTRVLLNDTANGGLKCYRTGVAADKPSAPVLVASSTGSISAPAVVDFGVLSGSVSYEFVFNAVKGGASTAIAGNDTWALKLDQWDQQNLFGTTQFGVADNVFTPLAGQNAASVFGRRVHVVVVSDTAAGASRLYIDGVRVGTWAGTMVLSGNVKVMGARLTQETDHMGAGSVMDRWATYQGALSDEEVATLAAAWPTNPNISIAKTEAGISITFTGTLQSADAVTGPWTDVAGATSPYAVAATGNQRFYRAKK